MSYIFFDCETTGLTKAESAPINMQPYITELCAIKTDEQFNVVDKYVEMFKVPIDVEVVQPGSKKSTFEITGISNAMLADKKPFVAHWREIADFFHGGKVMVAHNISYDLDCLFYELKRINKVRNFPWSPQHECTIEKSMHIRGHRLNLGLLHEILFGEKFDGAHRAESDVLAMIKCYKELKSRKEIA